MKHIPRRQCKELAQKISTEDLLIMVDAAAKLITDWTKPSRCNKSISRGVNWNMFCKDFYMDRERKSDMVNWRMVEEFGQYLPAHCKPINQKKTYVIAKVHHQEPIFLKTDNN